MKRLNEKERKRSIYEDNTGDNWVQILCLHRTDKQGTFIDDRNCAGILEQSMWARNRVGIGLSYRPARLHSWRNPFLGIDSWAPEKFKISSLVSVQCGLVKNVLNSVSDRVYMC
jgi:hypothetical protein